MTCAICYRMLCTILWIWRAIETPEKNSALRAKIKDVLSKGKDRISDNQLDDWVEALSEKFDDFVEIVPAV